MRLNFFYNSLWFLFFAIIILSPLSSPRAQTAPLERIATINGLAPEPSKKDQGATNLYIATQYGLLRANPNGVATLISDLKVGLMSMAAHPENPKIMLASGYLSETKKAGVLMSSDSGETWAKISDGAGDPVAFQFLSISRADPNIVYGGTEDELQISLDGGHSWKKEGKAPKQKP